MGSLVKQGSSFFAALSLDHQVLSCLDHAKLLQRSDAKPLLECQYVSLSTSSKAPPRNRIEEKASAPGGDANLVSLEGGDHRALGFSMLRRRPQRGFVFESEAAPPCHETPRFNTRNDTLLRS